MAIVFFGEKLNLVKEACEIGTDIVRVGGELGFVYGFKGKSVDNLARSRTDQDSDPCCERWLVLVWDERTVACKWMYRTLEAKVSKEGDIFSALLTLCQGRKDEESAPALAVANSDTLPSNGQTIHVALCNISTLHNASGANSFVAEIDKGHDDAAGEDPFRYVEGDLWLDGGGPAVEGQQLNSGKAIDGVDSNGNNKRAPEVGIGKSGANSTGFEISQVNIFPFLISKLARFLSSITTARHGGCVVA